MVYQSFSSFMHQHRPGILENLPSLLLGQLLNIPVPQVRIELVGLDGNRRVAQQGAQTNDGDKQDKVSAGQQHRYLENPLQYTGCRLAQNANVRELMGVHQCPLVDHGIGQH